METFEQFFNIDWQAFHFIRPTWLFAIIPLVLIAIGLKKINASKSGWQGILATHLYRHMVVTKGGKASAPPFYLLSLCWVLACVAMAGPTWQKLPQPVYQVNTGKVLIMDMSLSMRSTDVAPDRLTRARFKAIDLLNSIDDGEVGLVVYAGDAFTVSPLTSDVSNIIALIPSLRPEIMPVSGSYPLAAFEQAKQLLANAGYTKGDIYWISDGIDFDDVSPITDFISQSDFHVSILGVGTDAGAPIKQMDGSLLKDTSGNIVIPKLESRYFNQVSGAAQTSYVRLTIDDSDIEAMKLERVMLEEDQVKDEILGEGDQWQDMGAFIVMLMLPFAAYAFRRGILVIVCSAFIMSPAEHAYAQQNLPVSPATSPTSPPPSLVTTNADKQNNADQNTNLQSAFNNGFFKTDNQRGQQAFEQGDFEQAAELFDDPMWQGAAHYEQGNYEAALEQYELAEGNDAVYNQANAMAKLGDLQAALQAYEKVLASEPDHENALTNKEIVERLLEQQQQQDQQDSQNGDGEQENQDQNGENKDSEQGESEQSGSDQSSSDQNSSDQNSSDQSESQQNSEQQDGQQSDQEGKPQDEQNSEQQQGDAQQDEQQNDQAQNQGANGEQSDEQSNEQEQQAGNVEQLDEPLTPEQLEQLQRDRIMLNKVPDDPAFLLQRKMQLESQKRKRDRLPSASKKEW